MEELWNVIKESKQGLEYLPPEKQYKNLVTILSSLDKKEVKLIRVQWWNAIKELINRIDYKDMAVTRGGLVEDVLYDYFGNWIIAQGEELFNDINNDGILSIYKYIKDHNIPKEEFFYRCSR